MQFLYPHLSAGYLGVQVKNATLNSSFYAAIIKNTSHLQNTIIFPQRVPRRDFFTEMCFLEGDHISKPFKQLQINLISHTHNTLSSIVTKKQNPRSLLNYMNILMRYGLSEEICNLDIEPLRIHLHPNDLAEMELIMQICKHQISNSNNSNIINLAQKALHNSYLSTRVRIMILNYLIVAAARFNIELPTRHCLNECSSSLLNLVSTQSTNNFGDVVRQSAAYRGLAMINTYGSSMRNELLTKAEQLARDSKPNGPLEEIIAKENLYTCLQTLSKWNTNHKLLDQAKLNLNEMINLDPYDSTGYGEMAFFYLNLENYEEAANYFKLATKFGSPAVGMHTYYHGICLQSLGNINKAIEEFYKTTTIDPEAISPWLDLFDYYFENDLVKTQEIASLLLTNPIYRHQLEQGEIDIMTKFLKL